MISVPMRIAAALLGCALPFQTEAAPNLMKTDFGKTADGTTVDIYTLKNQKGMEARIITFGGRVVSLKVPDQTGALGDVVLGFDTIAGYTATNPYFGALIGRYGNRIGKARFQLDGKEYKLPANDGENSLHGGGHGFDQRVWKVVHATGTSLELSYLSKDGEEGYPGNLTATVRYTVTADNELRIEYSAVTDKDTVVNLTNHSYFNLASTANVDILSHELTLKASRFTPVDSGLIPTGELRSVEGTPLDFRTPHPIGERINQVDEQIKLGGGYDHNWVLDRTGPGLLLAASVHEKSTGRTMEVLTTEPGIQFYTGNFLDGTLKGKGGILYKKRHALCLETQHYPDSPNKPGFPSTLLKPGQKYHTTTIYRFLTDRTPPKH